MPTLPLPTSTATSTSISHSTPTTPVDLAVSYITPLPCYLLTSSWCSCKLTLQDARFGIKQSRETFSIKTTVSATVTLFCSSNCLQPSFENSLLLPSPRRSHLLSLPRHPPVPHHCYFLPTLLCALLLPVHKLSFDTSSILLSARRLPLSSVPHRLVGQLLVVTITSRRLITHLRALFLQHYFVLLCAHPLAYLSSTQYTPHPLPDQFWLSFLSLFSLRFEPPPFRNLAQLTLT